MTATIGTDPVLTAVDDIRTHPRNPRRGNHDAIRESIERHGFYGHLIAQRSSGYILVGNNRYLVARDMGYTQLPVSYLDVDDDTALAVLAGDNRTSDLASYDQGALANLLAELGGDDPQVGLAGTAYTGGDLSKLLNTLANEAGASEVEDPDADLSAGKKLQAEYGTDTGQLWNITDPNGLEHRMLIADSSDPEGPGRLLNGEQIDLLVTSPPYNVGVDYGKRGAVALRDDTRTPDEGESWDDRTTWDEYHDMLLGVMRPWVANLGRNRYVVWNLGASPDTYPHRQTVMMEDELGLKFHRMLIWHKVGIPLPSWHHTVQSGQVRKYSPHYSFELVYLFVNGRPGDGGEPLDQFDPTIDRDVFKIAQSDARRDLPDGDAPAGVGRNPGFTTAMKAHPAVYPVALPAAFATHLADPGAIVFDPFLGAGSTILAASQRGRRGYGVELSPEYAAVTLYRARALGMTYELVP